MNTTKHQRAFNEAKTARGAARAFHRWLTEWAREVYGTDCGIVIGGPDPDGWTSTGWAVGWDGGPYEGLIRLTMGASMMSTEFAADLVALYGREEARRRIQRPEFNTYGNPRIMVEPINHWLIGFYEQ